MLSQKDWIGNVMTRVIKNRRAKDLDQNSGQGADDLLKR